VDPGAGAGDLADEVEGAQAVGDALGQVAGDPGGGGEVGGGEAGREVGGQQVDQIRRGVEPADAKHLAQLQVGAAAPAAAVGPLRGGDRHQDDLEGEVGVVEEGGDADQLVEQVEQRAAPGRAARRAAGPLQVGLDGDRVDQEDAVAGEQAVELGAQGGERRGLDLDQQAGAADVDDEAVEGDLELVAGAGVARLERGVERALVEGADAGGWRGDRRIVARGAGAGATSAAAASGRDDYPPS